ncbi:MAG: TRAP transporter substrate-binding protein DctP [Deltaproteobacteria bacterium]|nr:TRAP transporter substrate-binding protein DctP [Deltaproteobacteria bacterium]
MRKLILIKCFQTFFLLLVLGPSISLAEMEYRIKFATVAPDGSTWMKHMRSLDQTLREKSQGQLGFSLYPGGIAGDELDVLRKIRIGQLHCAAFSGVGIAQILPMVRVLDLPFLFHTQEEITQVQNELHEYFLRQFRAKGFEFLSWAEVGDVHLFSKSPIEKISDVAGLKIWTWSGDPISKETLVAMGTNPIPLSITDVTTALNTGMIDTVYAPPLGALALQWHHQVKYMTLMPLAHATGAMLISNNYFNKIPSELTNLLKVQLKVTMDELTHDLIKQTNEAIQIIQENGIKIIPMPSPEEMKAFRKVHDEVVQKLSGNQYPRELLDKIYQILNRSGGMTP